MSLVFGILNGKCPCRKDFLTSHMAGSSEMILSAHHLAKVGVEGSNPFARSKNFNYLASFECGPCDSQQAHSYQSVQIPTARHFQAT